VLLINVGFRRCNVNTNLPLSEGRGLGRDGKDSLARAVALRLSLEEKDEAVFSTVESVGDRTRGSTVALSITMNLYSNAVFIASLRRFVSLMVKVWMPSSQLTRERSRTAPRATPANARVKSVEKRMLMVLPEKVIKSD
jgi:hypothetical protein